MAYYYVKYDTSDATDGQGTATGDGGRETTKRTGAWSTTVTEFYANITGVLTATTPPTDGDVIYVSNLHDKNEGATLSYAVPEGVTLISVDDINQDAYSVGATIDTGVGITADINLKGVWIGFTLASDDNIIFYGDSLTHLINTTITTNDTSAWLQAGIDSNVILTNCLIDYSNNVIDTNSILHNVGDSSYTLYNCTINSGGKELFRAISNASSIIELHNCDLSGMVNVEHIVAGLGTGYETTKVKLHKCTLPSSLTSIIASSLTISSNVILDIVSCTKPDLVGDTDDNDAYHYFYREVFQGVIQADTTYYLNATYNGSDGFSAAMNGTNNSIGNPLRHKLATLPQQSGNTATTYRVNVASASQLYTNNFFIEAEYSDDTDQALGVIVSTREDDILATGTEHTTYSGDTEWSGGGFTYEYEVDIVVPQRTNVANGLVAIYANLTDAIDVNVCPKIGID